MSGSGVQQAPGLRNHEPPAFGRQSSTPTFDQSQDDVRSYEASPFAPLAPYSTSTYSSLPSGLDSTRASTNYTPPDGPTERRGGHESPDPDEFYRQRSGSTSNATHSNFGDVTADTSDSMAHGSRHLNDRVSPLPTGTLDPSRTKRQPHRSTSESLGPGVSSTYASPFSSNRARQPSFKDLISKFEQNTDNSPPLPQASATTPRTASPTGSTDGGDRSRVVPRRKLRDSLPPTSATSYPSPRLDYSPSSAEALVPPPLVERIPQTNARRPLFGELLSVGTQLHNLGFGISAQLRRRGSDGSIPSPNPAFVDQSNPSSARSPLTPTAWYLGQTSSLEAVNSGHRRTRSEVAGNQAHQPLADTWDSWNTWDPDMAVSVPLQQTKPVDCSPGSPDSKSRIPVFSHRLVTASGTRNLSPSSNPPFSSRSPSIPLAPRGTSRLPKPSATDSPPRMTEDGPASFANTARSRRDMTIGRTHNEFPEPNRHLQAYISAPPPKKSPPLRSSRPRQPVANGNLTSGSKVGDRVSTLQKHVDRETHEQTPPRQRRLPELGNVDIETRRQRIQQAFNRTVQENERKEAAAELRRRRTRRQETSGVELEPAADEKTLTPTTAVKIAPPADVATVVTETTEPPTGGDQKSRIVPQLHVNTTIDASENNVPHTTMDSPTLGMPDEVKPQSRPKESSDTVPNSAVTTESNVTHFDPEPQFDVFERRPSASHRTLLNQIMQIRESSESDSCDDPDCSLSEADDKQSIHIMLGTNDTQGSRRKPQQPHANDPPQNRWSMSSWSSSLRNRRDTCDEECDESDNGAILQLPTPGPETEPATQSCSAASSPVSDLNDGQPIQDLGIMGPPTLHNTPQLQSSSVFSNPPSLAKKGRWDSRRVTELYLQELTRGRNNDGPLPSPSRSPQDYGTLEVDTRADGRNHSLADDPAFVPRFPATKTDRFSASLIGRDDWEHASPSIMDWMQIAAADEAITPSNDKPSFIAMGVPTPRLGSAAEEDSGNLNQSFEPSGYAQPKTDPPAELSAENSKVDNQSHSNHTQLLSSGRVPTLRDPAHSTGSSEDSSFRRLEPEVSPPAADSSNTSLAPSFDHPEYAELKKSPSPEQRRLKKRRHIIKELVDTEYTFGRDMKVVDDIYKGTSGSCLDLSADDVKVLFANSEQIVQFSLTFQDALKEATRIVYRMPKSQRWNSGQGAQDNPPGSPGDDEQGAAEAKMSELEKDSATTVGEAFMLHMVQMEKVYSDYLKNHDAANKKLQILQRNPKVAIWLKECRDWASDLTSAWDLDSLLVKPVQRILKYPLLLTELLDSTPNEHPDRVHLLNALQEVTNISVRINEMKKRAEVVGQVVGRKRNQSDVRAGLSKAFGRRTEKLRQQVGLSGMFEDKTYDALADKFGEQYVQLQLLRRDVDDYIEHARKYVAHLNELAAAIEGIIDVAQTNYVDLESKWHRFKLTIRQIVTVALPEHVDVVTKFCIDPTLKVITLYNGPERVMKKRNKRMLDYARYKAVKDRGDKPDKKTREQGEQFVALNETLKDELPRLYSLSGKFGQACLQNFIQIQGTWCSMIQQKLEPHVESFPDDLQKIICDWNSDYSFSDAQILSLGICNGSLLADTVNLVNFNTPSTGAPTNSSRRTSTISGSNPRPGSMVEDSPKVSYDYGTGQLFQSPQFGGQAGANRRRTGSAISGRAPPEPADVGRSQLLQQVTNTSSSNAQASSTADVEPFPTLPQLSLDTPFLADMINESPSVRASLSDDYPPTSPGGQNPNFFSSAMSMTDETSETGGSRARIFPSTDGVHETPNDQSNFFSSAMPMSDGTHETDTPPQEQPVYEVPKVPKVLFLAASIYEFNIDRARREAGYPYLTYVAGEIFDVIGEKGELWLARNQDDPTHQVGWIWNKHFAKLSS